LAIEKWYDFLEAGLERCERSDEKGIKDVCRMEAFMQGEEFGDDKEVVFFPGDVAQRTVEDSRIEHIWLGGPSGELTTPGMWIQVW
jgi:hypothetical protein